VLEKRGGQDADDAVVSVQQILHHPTVSQGISWTAACIGGDDEWGGVWVGFISEANLAKARLGFVDDDDDDGDDDLEDREAEPLSLGPECMDFVIQLTGERNGDEHDGEINVWEQDDLITIPRSNCSNRDSLKDSYYRQGDKFEVTVLDNSVHFLKNGKTIYT
jgi:hypothetical protein